MMSISAKAQVAPSPEAQAANDANSPLTPTIMLSAHNYYIPSLNGVPDRDADVTLFRGLLPHLTFGKPQLFRFTLPVSTTPTFPTGSKTGVGDLLLMDLVMFPGKKVSFGVGPVVVAPTASSQRFGNGKWQVGASGAVVAPQSWGLLGGLAIYQHSVAGDNDRSDVRLLTVQPIAFYNLPKGFYLRSSGIWNFDLKTGNHYVPVGAGVGKIWAITKKVRLNTFAEPQYSVIQKGIGAPKWQIYAGVNVQIAAR
ncbi:MULTISPECIES: hypothetical protein [unclassified Novosphingobium]|nr:MULTISPECIES: hypothetical protein [unclassified Novosphingobium]NKJ45112.1 hypothetical protein [Novosphingobium sp. SG720]NMN88723.1 hypothetical protein [Novosphingobium sp. SG916]